MDIQDRFHRATLTNSVALILSLLEDPNGSPGVAFVVDGETEEQALTVLMHWADPGGKRLTHGVYEFSDDLRLVFVARDTDSLLRIKGALDTLLSSAGGEMTLIENNLPTMGGGEA